MITVKGLACATCKLYSKRSCQRPLAFAAGHGTLPLRVHVDLKQFTLCAHTGLWKLPPNEQVAGPVPAMQGHVSAHRVEVRRPFSDGLKVSIIETG